MNSDVNTWALPEGAIARLGRGDVFALAFSPDQKTHLAVGSSIGLWLYNMSTQEPIALWDTERGLICDIAFSLNRKWLSTYNLDGVVKVWDIQRGECVTRLELEDRISNIVFSPDSQGLAIAYLRRPRVEIRHPKTGELRANSPVKLKRTAILVSPFHLILVSSQRRKGWTEIAMLNASKSGTSHAGNKLHTSLDTQTACAESPFHRAVGFWHQAARRMEQCECGRLKADN